MLAKAIDRAMDWTVLPGYSRIGIAIRRSFWSQRAEAGLMGSKVLVTGASSGIGAAACEIFARGGAVVHMLVRDREKGERMRRSIVKRTGSQHLQVEVCDLASLASVRTFASDFATRERELQVLVNNAGVMPPERTRTAEGFELTFATNVLGPFLLTNLLLAPLCAGAPSRVINVSSGGMYTERLDVEDVQLDRRDYDPPAFYAHTKRCEVILTELWAERMRGSGVSFHSMHPGWADTPGVQASLPTFRRFLRPLLRDSFEAADTIAWLAGAPEPAAGTGRFWHDRAIRPTHRLARTRETTADRERLWDQCAALSGWADQAEAQPVATADGAD
jgi:NAD(P)-dependent dehydrogenase (short-subunit alcohol dehydrogenase family)